MTGTIPLHEVKSGLIAAIGFDAATETMAVQFKNGGKVGATYHYFEVPEAVYRGVAAAESVGRAFTAFVKSKFRFERVAEPPKVEGEQNG